MRLIRSKSISQGDKETVVSGKLREILYAVKKEMKIVWSFHAEASCFADEDGPDPCSHPDFRFTGHTPDSDQYEYDIECKLVRVKRSGKSHNYCKYYVNNGIQRFQDGNTYAQSAPPMGIMIGYVQEGDIFYLLQIINTEAIKKGFNQIESHQEIKSDSVSKLYQDINRTSAHFTLHHLWVDLR